MSEADPLAEQYRALLEVSEAIAAHHDLTELFRALAQRLPRVLKFSSIVLALHDPSKNVMRLHVLEDPRPMPVSPGLEFPVEDVPGGWVWQHQQPLICHNLDQETRFPKVMPMIRQAGIWSLCIVPLTSAREQLGAIGVGSLEAHYYGQAEIDFLQQVAKQVAVAVENTLNFERVHQAEKEMRRQYERERLMLEINNAVVSHLGLRDLLKAISFSLRPVIPHDAALLTLHEPGGDQLRLHALDLHMFGTVPFEEGVLISLHDTPEGQAIASRQPVLVGPVVDLTRFSSPWVLHAVRNGVRSGCAVPLITHNRTVGALSVVSAHENAFGEADAVLLSQCGKQIAIAVENVLAYQEIATLKDKLNKEKLYLEGEIRSELNFEEIIGESSSIKKVLKQVDIVAPTDSTVLILGETGTGKELLARAIHDRSKRRERTFVKLNCAAIPTGLLESELFGHERGAFTGAIATKVGRFELADGGTLFLDEVGDIPLELQSKLLRVLQEQEFERLGSTRTIKVSVRLLAATNRDLADMVENKLFRSDLYYRLNVFPLTVPALRDRRQDIPLLVRYFAQQLARRMDKTIDTIPTETLTALSRYSWPGNIRELENLIERAVILTQGTALYVPLAELKQRTGDGIPPPATLEETEREHILRILKSTKWVIGGPTGAAAQLGMKRTTLQSKMQRLGIARPV
ncbi:sigma 54-interacting transcriptional regulator [Nitrospira sp. BLG_1]|uniref:sigma 54-interacting transcriptional regulator n=1 Tax=Nitrospira sp. BLG_1 TaxID=3395883 RepID=UPI0039BD2C9F